MSEPSTRTVICNLQDVPAELWFSISFYLGQQSVLTISLTSKRMHELATPGLYRQICYWSSRSEAGILRGERAEILRGTRLEYLTEESITSSYYLSLSRIFKPNALSKSLTRSSWLRSLVHSIDFRWHDSGHDKCLYRLLEVLSYSPLQHVYLYPSHAGFVLPPSIPVNSLGTKWQGNIDSDRVQRVHDLIFLPSLRHMYFQSWESGGRSQLRRLDNSSASLQQASNITHLSFHGCNVRAGHLQAIVGWPRALRSFLYSDFPAKIREVPTIKQVYSTLRPHQSTLEEITLRFEYCECI